MNLRSKVMIGENTKWYLVALATLSLGTLSTDALCLRGRTWWDRQRNICAPCTRCDPTLKQAVKYPCELHRDTICQSLYEVKIFPFNTQTQNDSENEYVTKPPSQKISVSDYEYYEYVDYNSDVTSDVKVKEDVSLDVQTITLTLALCGCVVFFVVVLFMSIYHAKQWKILKQALKSDVQDLSAKLKLMEAGAEPPTEPVVSTDHHIYCNIQVAKEGLLGPVTNKKGFGNVYTQEKHSS